MEAGFLKAIYHIVCFAYKETQYYNTVKHKTRLKRSRKKDMDKIYNAGAQKGWNCKLGTEKIDLYSIHDHFLSSPIFFQCIKSKWSCHVFLYD